MQNVLEQHQISAVATQGLKTRWLLSVMTQRVN